MQKILLLSQAGYRSLTAVNHSAYQRFPDLESKCSVYKTFRYNDLPVRKHNHKNSFLLGINKNKIFTFSEN